ncbi:SGNH/GDSL hydrolase family protein [Algoriphagus aestuariicola]|uniref:SGNH/GDSL hydrolase family protein n=1 Tax=Algoriphagus aestuariicola TaxID=1852016 RepID=A0ABS3BV96_9BACT|nr:SGNH/GDSL hydrolase family protein [Algoriphagus aestuariicola]MBN7802816.1 SGNH/GDSL hydrolase family protein [Algoriphagus aestuariicola]
MVKYIPVLLLFSLINFQSFAQNYAIPEETKRIVFLGNSITYNGKFVSYLDAYFTLAYPDRNLEIINLGLPSETVSGLSEPNHAEGKFPRPDLRERLQRVLTQLKPDLVIANYGMNDGIYLPLDDDRFEKFKDGMEWMHQTVENSGAKIIHVTPPIYDPRKGAAYANVLDVYSDWLISLRYTKQWQVIDLHWPMRKALEDNRFKNPDFVFAKDGVHPNEAGHFLMAKEILMGLGETEMTVANSIEELLTDFPEGMNVLQLIQKRQEILRNAWLTQTGHQRPGLAEGMPIEEAKNQISSINQEINSVLRQH